MDKNLKNKDSTITVLMPVHNGEKYIRLAIDSILSQDFADFELLIIDDASTDGSVEIVKSYKDLRIRLLHNQKQLGLAGTRKRGLTEARGKYIAFLDCDDISLSHRLRTQLEYLMSHSDIPMLGSWVRLIDENGNLTQKIWRHQASSVYIPSILFFRNCFSQSSVFLKKDCLANFPYRDRYWAAPDYDLWTRFITKHKAANIPDVLVLYRYHSKSMSFQKEKEITKCTMMIMMDNIKRLGFIPSNEELVIHDNLERKEDAYSDDLLDNTLFWLEKLIFKNDKIQIFNKNIFRSIVSDYWFKVCCQSAKRGNTILRKYNSSFLGHDRTLSLRKKIILSGLCTLKLSKIIDITSDSWR